MKGRVVLIGHTFDGMCTKTFPKIPQDNRLVFEKQGMLWSVSCGDCSACSRPEA